MAKGGARVGAGRKKKSEGEKRVTVTITVNPAALARFRNAAEKENTTANKLMSKIIERARP